MKKILKSSVSMLMSLCLLLSSFTGLVIPAAAEADYCGYEPEMDLEELLEEGLEAEAGKCYSISDDEDLVELHNYVESGKNTEGVTFYLKKNIKLPEREWVPIGTAEHMFAGTLDGCGYTVSGVYTMNDAYYSEAALFGYLTGTVMNLGVNGKAEGGKYSAGIAAVAYGARIVNCWSAVQVKCQVAGGIVGQATDTRIVNCCNYGDVAGSLHIGGIAGELLGQCQVEYCYYTYYGAQQAAGAVSSESKCVTHRFGASPTMCVLEKEVEVGGTRSEDLTAVLNIWADTQTDGVFYRSWVFDLSDENVEKTGGRYPVLKFPNYTTQEADVYIPTSSMTTLYESDTNVERGACYSISSAEELGFLAEYCNKGRDTHGATFYLTCDISIITKEAHFKGAFLGESWIPIGDTAGHGFRGTFDGQGFIISDVTFGQKDDYPGLFGYVNDNDAVIKNLGVTGNVPDGETSGGIVCDLMNGKIFNSWYSGNVTGDDYAGGIAGRVRDGLIENCVYFGTATSRRFAGGIVGFLENTGDLRYCYFTSDNVAAAGDLQGKTYLCVQFRMLENVYTLTRSVKINAESTVRLLNALNDWVDARPTTDYYRWWKVDKSAESVARVRGSHPAHIFFGDAVKVIREAETEDEKTPKENPYNVRYSETATMTQLYESKANVIKGANYSINSGEEMELLSRYVEDGYDTHDANFYLTNDIYLTTSGMDHAGAGWVPIGTGISIDFEITGTMPFYGDFDGCGYTVYGMYIVSDFLDFTGLFGRCKGSTIKNLGVCGDILGDDEVGGIVGRIEDGEIINCWSAVNIQCSTDLGGIAGHIIDSRIENCACYGILVTTLDEHENSGGVFGESVSDCTVKNCYYLYSGADAAYNEISKGTVLSDVYYFHYDLTGDQSCTLKQAITVDDVTSDDLLTLLNAWVYMQNSEQYSTWHTASSTQEVPGANGYFPVLLKPTFDAAGDSTDYMGDYTETATMSALYSTRADGMQGGFYSISNCDDLNAFRSYVNAGYETKNITFFMKQDIDMSKVWAADTNQSWTPVGTTLNPFQGIFDGQGYTLKYLYIESSEDDQAFFGHVTGVNALIKNLGVTGNVFTSGKNAAGIVADFNFGTIANCWASCGAEAVPMNAGGIAGACNMGNIYNCASYGVVVSTGAYGGIAGFPVGTVIQCCYYCYGTCQQAYPPGSTPVAANVCSFNGTGAACILENKITINGTETKNAASALKLYVDAYPEINYCYWDVADSMEYYIMGVFGFPVLISASNTKGSKDYKTEQAEFNGEKYYTVMDAVDKANEHDGGGTVKLLINAVLQRSDKIALDNDVTLDTDGYTLIIKTSASARYMSQLMGDFVVKEGGGIYLWDDTLGDYRPFIFSRKTADPSCDSEFFGNSPLTITSKPVESSYLDAYDLTLVDGEFKVNSSSNSGNPHRIPGGSRLTIGESATLNVITNARIRTTGGAQIFNNGKVIIGNATLDRNTGCLMKGIFEDSGGRVTLPYIYRDGYTLRGWTDGTTIFNAGTTITVSEPKTLTAQWKIGDSGDPYPGDDAFHDPTDKVYDIAISVLQTDGGTVSPESFYAARGDNVLITVRPGSGYYVKTLLVDGKKVELTEDYTYNLPSVAEAHQIVALFGPHTNTNYYDWMDLYKFKARYTDVKSSDWFYRAVCEVSAQGLFVGTSETTFSPELAMTREMLVTVLWRMSGQPIIPGDSTKFTDVPEDSYALEPIRWAEAFGIVQGMSETKFGYELPITREQFVTILFRYARDYVCENVNAYDMTNILGYKDVLNISYGMTQAFQWAVGAKIMLGIGDNTLDPRGTTTRAQAAEMLYRFCNKFIYIVPIIGA